MLSIEEQGRVRARLDALSPDQLRRLWQRFGIELVGDGGENVRTLSREWLIGPLLADTEYEELMQAIEEARRSQPAKPAGEPTDAARER